MYEVAQESGAFLAVDLMLGRAARILGLGRPSTAISGRSSSRAFWLILDRTATRLSPPQRTRHRRFGGAARRPVKQADDPARACGHWW